MSLLRAGEMTDYQSATIWFTGVPGAGKTTIAKRLQGELRAMGMLVERLDGDVVRNVLSNDLGFSKRDRNIHVRQIGLTCSLLSRNGVFSIAATVSPYREVRQQVRLMHEPNRFIEVLVTCPLPELVARDRKNLYARALRGEIPNFTGISDPYEAPAHPEIVVHTNTETVEQSVNRIIEWLRLSQYLPQEAPFALQVPTVSAVYDRAQILNSR
jgi:adenylyl-sulfate kinase